MKINTQYNYDYKNNVYEINTLPSQTIPDQAMSIPELIKRYASGLPLGGSKVPIYQNEEEDLLNGTNWNKLDLSEQMDFMRSAKNELNDINKRLQESKKQRNNKENPTTDEEQ